MVFGSGEFRLHLFSPEPPRKVSGFLSETSQSFAFLLDLSGPHGSHDLFEARVAAQIIHFGLNLRWPRDGLAGRFSNLASCSSARLRSPHHA